MWSLNTLLAEKMAWYRLWMQNPHSSPIHLALFGLFSALAFMVVFGQVSEYLLMQEEANVAVVLLAKQPATRNLPEHSKASPIDPTEIIVGYKASIGESKRSEVANALLLTKQGEIKALNAVVYTASSDDTAREAADRLRHLHSADVVFVEPNVWLAPELTPDDPLYSTQWHTPLLGIDTAWDTVQGVGKTVAIVDTGVDCAHEELAASCLGGYNIPSQNTNAGDVYGHGTKVAGVVAAATNNAVGVAGAAYGAKILPVRITNDSQGMASYSDIANGILYAADHGASVINVSYAAYDSQTVASAAAYAVGKGAVLVVAAGNDGVKSTTKNDVNMVVVAATDTADRRATWSNFGAPIDVAAPGTAISTTAPGGGFISMSGTSFAAPLIAAVTALVWSHTPALTVDEITRVILGTAQDIGTKGYDEEYGFGRVDALTALRTVASGTIPTITYPNSSQSQPLALTSYAVVSKTKETGVVAWATNLPATGRVRYGTSPSALAKVVEVTTPNMTQQASVTGLDPRKKYYYQVEAVDVATGATVKSPVSEFRTRR
jgi:subtilisin family serine protease